LESRREDIAIGERWAGWIKRLLGARTRELARVAECEYGIVARSISKAFGGTPVLDNVSFSAKRGRFVTLLGPSGCGKTTLLRIIAGLELPDTGQLEISGQLVDGLPANKRPVNTVFQSYALFPHLSVFDNVAFGLRARRIREVEVASRVASTLELLHISQLSKRRPAKLSGGEKQRVALARALVNEPEVLLLDEPMSALDARLRRDLQVELRRLQRRLGTTFLLVTHDQVEAMTVSDHLLVLNAGRIVQAGTPAEVYETPRSRMVAEFLGIANLIPARREGNIAHTDLGDLQVRFPANWSTGNLMIRPEKVALQQQPTATNALRVAVKDCQFSGDYVDLWLEPGGLRARCPSANHFETGETMWVCLPEEHLHCLEAEATSGTASA